MTADIIFAIKHKKKIIFQYEGHLRIVEPYALGINKMYEEIIFSFQTAAESSMEGMGWKEFKLSQITNLLVTEEHFNFIRTGYTAGLVKLRMIRCEVQSYPLIKSLTLN